MMNFNSIREEVVLRANKASNREMVENLIMYMKLMLTAPPFCGMDGKKLGAEHQLLVNEAMVAIIKSSYKSATNLWKNLVASAFGVELEKLSGSPLELIDRLEKEFTKPNAVYAAAYRNELAGVTFTYASNELKAQFARYNELVRLYNSVSEHSLSDTEKSLLIGRAMGNTWLANIATCAAVVNRDVDYQMLHRAIESQCKVDFSHPGSKSTTPQAPFESSHFSKNTNSNNKCLKCGKAGHWARDCRWKGTCSKCGSNTHASETCRKPTPAAKSKSFQKAKTDKLQAQLAASLNPEAFGFMAQFETPIFTHDEPDEKIQELPSDAFILELEKLPSDDEGDRVVPTTAKRAKIYLEDDFCIDYDEAYDAYTCNVERPRVRLIADSGCSFGMIGKDLIPFAVNIKSHTTSYSTANGKINLTQVGEIHGLAVDVEGKEVPLVFVGSINPNLSVNLVPVYEGLFSGNSNTKSWIKLDKESPKFILHKVNGMNTILLHIQPAGYDTRSVCNNALAVIETAGRRARIIKQVFERTGYLTVSGLGQALTDDEIIKSVSPFIRHMHCRLMHIGVDSLRATLSECGLIVSKKETEDAIRGCRMCLLKHNLLKKFDSVENRGKVPEKALLSRTKKQRLISGTEKAPQEATVEEATVDQIEVVPMSNITEGGRGYEGVGVHPNHCILQDVTYCPVVGIFGGKGMSVILDMKTRLVSCRVVKYSKDEGGNLTLETSQHLVNWTTSKGYPTIVKSDNGVEFQGTYHQFCLKNTIDHQFGAPYTPQQQGSVERVNSTLKKLIAVILKVFNWPENHWELVLGSCVELYNITASGSRGTSPHKDWFGTNPDLRVLPGDRVVVNASNYPALRSEEIQKLGKTLFVTYVHREGKLANIVLLTKDRGVARFYVPLRVLGLTWYSLFDAALEGAKIFKEPRGLDKTLNALNQELETNKQKLESLIWEKDDSTETLSKEFKKMLSKESTPDLSLDLVCKVENIIRQKEERELIRARGGVPVNLQVRVDPDVTREAKYLANSGHQACLVLSYLNTLQGKTHEDVSQIDIRNGSHDISMSSELKQFTLNKVLGTEISEAEAKTLGLKIINSRWVHTWKLKSSGRVAKSRLVLQGFMDKENVPVFVDLPSAKFRRLAMTLGLSLEKDAYIVDVRTAFLQAPLPEGRKIVARLPRHLPEGYLAKGFKPGGVYELKKAMYGLQDSPRAFSEWLKRILEKLSWISVGWGCFVRQDNSGGVDIIVAYVDDLWIWSNMIDGIYEELTSLVSMDEPIAINSEWTRYIGIDVRRDTNQIQVSVKSYVEGFNLPERTKGFIRDSEFPVVPATDEELDFSLIKTMQECVGKLGWVAANHPGLSYLFGELSRHAGKPSAKILDLTQRVMACIKCSAPVPMSFLGVFQDGEVRVWTDASLRRQGLAGIGRMGYMIQYVEANTAWKSADNMIAWGSIVDKRKHPSTSSAEISALILGLRESVEIVRAIRAITRNDVYLNGYVDAKVVTTQLQTGKAGQNPFDQSNVEYVLQCLRDLIGIGVKPEPTVIHVGTKEQKADAMTKYLRGVWTSMKNFGGGD